MNKKRKWSASLFLLITLFLAFVFPANAAELPDGSVMGLPENLVILDDSGRYANSTGEYYFCAENMIPGETYTKKIQIMNLRTDAAYDVLFRAEPLTSEGDFDLSKECDCEIYLDKQLVYKGLITGEGTPDIRGEPLNLGSYESGQNRLLEVRIKWNGTSAGGFIDKGEKVVDADGTTVVRGSSGKNVLSGETTFKWIFSAEVSNKGKDIPKEPTDSSQPGGMIHFIQTGETVMYIIFIVIAVGSLLLSFLLLGKKKKTRKQ